MPARLRDERRAAGADALEVLAGPVDEAEDLEVRRDRDPARGERVGRAVVELLVEGQVLERVEGQVHEAPQVGGPRVVHGDLQVVVVRAVDDRDHELARRRGHGRAPPVVGPAREADLDHVDAVVVELIDPPPRLARAAQVDAERADHGPPGARVGRDEVGVAARHGEHGPRAEEARPAGARVLRPGAEAEHGAEGRHEVAHRRHARLERGAQVQRDLRGDPGQVARARDVGREDAGHVDVAVDEPGQREAPAGVEPALAREARADVDEAAALDPHVDGSRRRAPLEVDEPDVPDEHRAGAYDAGTPGVVGRVVASTTFTSCGTCSSRVPTSSTPVPRTARPSWYAK